MTTPTPTKQHSFQIDLADQPPGFWIALILKIIMALGVFLYLATHSLNYFANTFREDQKIFSYLGLLTTSVGFVGWLTQFKWMARTSFEKTIALFMTFVSLIGELYVAGYDIIYNTSKTAPAFEQVQVMGWVVAGLAAINGLAMVADFAGLDIMVLFEQRKSAKAKMQTETDAVPEIRVYVNAALNKVSFSDKTHAFYCPPTLEAQVREFVTAPGRWESVEVFLKHVNANTN